MGSLPFPGLSSELRCPVWNLFGRSHHRSVDGHAENPIFVRGNSAPESPDVLYSLAGRFADKKDAPEAEDPGQSNGQHKPKSEEHAL